MSFKFGSKTTILVSSPEIIDQFLHKHDIEFSNRLYIDGFTANEHHKLSMSCLPAETGKWRILRKLCKEHIFSSNRLNATQGLRQEKVQELCNYVQECCNEWRAITIGEAVFSASFNLMWNIFFSVDHNPPCSTSSREIKEIVWHLMRALGSPNIVDFFPILRGIDPQGMRRRAVLYSGKLLDIIEGIICQRIKERGKSIDYVRRNDFLETLLDVHQQNEAAFSYGDLTHLLLDLFIGGTETNATTVEWAVAELLRNPDKKSKARKEITEILGKNDHVQESDISNLPYLQSLVKETFRRHPAAPLMVRCAMRDIEINGYMVPKNAQVFVNLWGMAKDPNLWLNPDSFEPEWFMEKDIDVKGKHFELLPFGKGRRICPGLLLAHRMVHLVLASLLHKFDWKLEGGMKPEELDMSEKFGITMHKAVALSHSRLKLEPLGDVSFWDCGAVAVAVVMIWSGCE